MNTDRMDENLSRALRALGDETRRASASPAVRDALLAELRPARRHIRLSWAHAAAAAVVLVGFGFAAAYLMRTPAGPGPEAIAAVQPFVEPVPGPVSAAPVEAAPDTPVARPAVRRSTVAKSAPKRWSDAGELRPITPWFYNSALPAVQQGQVIQLDVPAATAARFGVRAQGPVKAELFIADDGLTRAIRFVQ